MVGADKVEFVDFFLVVVVVVAMTTTTTTASVGLPFCANVSTCLPREREMRDIWTNNESASKNDVANVQQPIDLEKGEDKNAWGRLPTKFLRSTESDVGDLRQGDWRGVLKGPQSCFRLMTYYRRVPIITHQ